MPVRARSRASRSSRKASQFCADGAQLVELGVDAGGDDAAVAQQHRRLVGDGAQRLGDAGVGRQRRVQRVEQRRAGGRGGAQRGQRGQRVAQAGQFARAHRAQRDARGDALDVADAAAAPRAAARSRAPCRAPIASWRCAGGARSRSGCVSQWRSSAAAHAGAAAVEQRQQRRRVLAAQRLRQLPRLRCVAGGSSSRSLARSTCRLRTCASAWPWVCSA